MNLHTLWRLPQALVDRWASLSQTEDFHPLDAVKGTKKAQQTEFETGPTETEMLNELHTQSQLTYKSF